MGSDRLYKEILHKFKMNEARRVVIVLPDERRLELLVQPNLLTSDLLDLTTSQVSLKEKEYFGLAFIDDTGHYSWLQHDRRVLEHDFPKRGQQSSTSSSHSLSQAVYSSTNNNKADLVLYFLVKFYVESLNLLRDSRTVEHFYVQMRSLIFRGQLEVDSETAFSLAALALQSSYGDFIDESSARIYLKKLPVLPTSALKEHPSISYCEDRVIEQYRSLSGQTRGQAIINYLSTVEKQGNYGVHFYEVKDKRNIPWWLGISYKGIAQYDYSDRKQPRRVFLWKELENLYFRDRKFSIEVHDPRRIVHAVSSPGVYSSETSEPLHDDLSDAFHESSTQVSVSRRTYQAGTISVIVWFAQTQALTKNIWHMAICQHQFYLERKNSKAKYLNLRKLTDIAADLSKSTTSLSLSTGSSNSQSNLSQSGSTSSLNGRMGQTPECEESEASRAARMEIVAALKARKEALEEKLKSKLEELKSICLKEGELTGQLPTEFPLSPGEAPPSVRRRVGTSFTLPENLLNKAKSSKEESLSALELEYEIQRKITSAAFKLATDSTVSKAVRRQRKLIHHQNLQQLKDIEAKLRHLRESEAYGSTQAQPQVPVLPPYWSKQKKKPRPAGSGTAPSDEEGGFVRAEDDAAENTSGCDSLLADSGVNLSPAPPPIVSPLATPPSLVTTPTTRRDRSLSPLRRGQAMGEAPAVAPARSAPSSPAKTRAVLQNSHSYQGYHNHQVSHPPLHRHNSGGYVQNSVYLRSSYRSKQYPTLNSQPPHTYHNHGVGARVPAAALCPPLVGVDPNAGGGLYNIPRQRASHNFPSHSMDDLEVVGLRRLTGDVDRGQGQVGSIQGQSQGRGGYSPANHNSSFDFEWDFGEDKPNAVRRLDHLISHKYNTLDRRPQMNGSSDTLVPGSRSMDELDSRVSVDVVDTASIGPRFGGRGPRKVSQNYDYDTSTLLPNQTYPEYVDFGASSTLMTDDSRKLETVFDVDSTVFTRTNSVGAVSAAELLKKREKDWYETSLDSPVTTRKNKGSDTATVRAQPVRVAEVPDTPKYETALPFEAPKNMEVISPGMWEPYREVSKPFETSDIYKYSNKFRQQQQHQVKGLYNPPQPLACQPLNAVPSANRSFDSGDNNNRTQTEFRPKPATLV